MKYTHHAYDAWTFRLILGRQYMLGPSYIVPGNRDRGDHLDARVDISDVSDDIWCPRWRLLARA